MLTLPSNFQSSKADTPTTAPQPSSAATSEPLSVPPSTTLLAPPPLPPPPPSPSTQMPGFSILPQQDTKLDNTSTLELLSQLEMLGGQQTPSTPTSQTDSLSSASDEPSTAGVGDELSESNINLYPSGTPSAADVNQHGLGDCYLDSVLAGMANTSSGQSAIQKAIQSNGGSPPTYTVHMYAPDGSPVDVTVDSAMDSQGVTDKSGQMDWASVMEKAFAKYNDTYHVTQGTSGYGGIAEGGTSDVVMEAFTGHSASTTDLSNLSPTEIATQLANDLSSGKVVTAGSESSGTLADGTGIVGEHAYTVEGVNSDGTITLRNPWGSDPGTSGDGTITISAADFQKYFGVAWAG